MKELRAARDRGYADHGWLRSHHSFSFAGYYDPAHMGFGPLRVINDDWIAPAQGFGTHGHRDMEIITYVLEGAIAHKDNMGNASTIRPGNVQRMSAGRGVMHSEFNPSADEATHLLQIWIEPDRRDVAPGYEEKHFDAAAKRGMLRLIASPDGREGSVRIHQNAFVHAGLFDGAENARHALTGGRRAYVHVARGKISVNGESLETGDALKLGAVDEIALENGQGAEVLLFDLA